MNKKTNTKRANGKKLVGAWVEAKISEALRLRLTKIQKDRPRENISDIIYDALRTYLAPELEEINKEKNLKT